MIEIDIPGFKTLQLKYLVLDYNGTIACDGQLLPGVEPRLNDLSKQLDIHVITADTFGSVASEIEDLPCQLTIIPENGQVAAKQKFVGQLGAGSAVAIGNGYNDHMLLREAALGILVIQTECAAVRSLVKRGYRERQHPRCAGSAGASEAIGGHAPIVSVWIIRDFFMQTYQLHIRVKKSIEIQIGKLGRFQFPAGTYVYTGSAKRNLEKRIERHLQAEKKLRWHIDFLLAHPNVEVTRVERFGAAECVVNQATSGTILIPKFGASDCRNGCGSHLKFSG